MVRGQWSLFADAGGPELQSQMQDESELIGACLALIGRGGRLTRAEQAIADAATGYAPSATRRGQWRDAIRRGNDPLGDAFTAIRSAQARRSAGAVYTPFTIVQSMLAWLARQGEPQRIVDPGAGSGRFLLAAGQLFPQAQLVAVEKDPLAALMLRANLSARGWMDRATLLVDDYRAAKLRAGPGITAFIGNPPYVRHHDIEAHWKRWYVERSAELGIRASALAGLHLHFFLQTRRLAKPGDVGVFITPAEWLDVNYGAALRQLLLDHLGGLALHVLSPAVEAFAGTATTSAIACFRVGDEAATMRLRSVEATRELDDLKGGTAIAHATLKQAPRWSVLVRPQAHSAAGGEIELGELLRVHRGQVTGANQIWIAGPHARNVPQRFKWPTVTRAKDLIAAGHRLPSGHALRQVIDLPAELDQLADEERASVETFLRWAREQGADNGYIARHRKAWWSVGLRAPAPILCTYMARRPPQFTLNACGARHINVAHGLYPRVPLSGETLQTLVAWLNVNVGVHLGRVYAGGLTKFEPKEIERLRIPRPESLAR